MRHIFRTIALSAPLIFGGAAQAETAAADRVVAVGGSVTEIIYALGQQDRLIARDTTSIYPPEALDLPDVGYIRALSPEGLLSVNPGLVIAEGDIGPPETLAVIESARIPFVRLDDTPSEAGILSKIHSIGEVLDVPEAANALAQTVKADLGRAMARTADIPEDERKSVLFILSMQGGRMMASGTGTGAAAVIEMAGGRNALPAFRGYKPISDEAILNAAPDMILMMSRGGNAPDNTDALMAMPAIAISPAGKTGNIVNMDGLYLLGFGPRTAQAVNDLTGALYGE